MADNDASICESLAEKVEEPAIIEPVFDGYQLIGDSQFLRFSESQLNLKRKERNGFSVLGLCVSGQRIEHLLRRVETGFADVAENVVVMIGTNDLLGGTTFEKMNDDLEKLLQLLSEKAKKIILLTVPPVLKLEKSRYHWDRLKKYNEFIQKLHDDEKFFVGDAYAEFVIPKESPSSISSTRRSSDFSKFGRSLRSTPMAGSVGYSTCPENEDIASLSPPPPKRRFCRSSGWPKVRAESSPFEAHESRSCRNRKLKVRRSRAAKKRHSLPDARTMSTAFTATAPPDIPALPTKHFSDDEPIVSSDSPTIPSRGSALMPSSGDTTVISSDNVTTLPTCESAVSFDKDTLPSCDATPSSCDPTSPSCDLTSPSGDAATPCDKTLPSCLLTSFLSDLESISSDSSLSGSATPPSGNSTPPSSNAASPCRETTPVCVETIMCDNATVSSAGAILSDILMSDIMTSDSAVTPSGVATSYAGDAATTSSDAEKLSSDNVSLVDPVATPDDAVSLPSDAFSPSCDLKLHSGGVTPVRGGAGSPIGGQLPVSDDAALHSGDRKTRSGGAVSSSGDATLQSDGAITPCGRSTRSISGSATTPSTGRSDGFATPSSKNFHRKRRSDVFWRGDHHYYWKDDNVEIPNADKIRDEYFEKYYDSDCKRPDLIHLNAGGLLVIRRIIQDIIATVDAKEPDS